MIDITEIGEKTLLTQLCCSICTNYLSVPPISINKNGSSICGRCQDNVDISLLTHNIHYEHLACSFLFPCRFESEGCFIKQPLSKMKLHEDSCIYQKIYCKECKWAGIFIELIIHYSTNHQKQIITNDCSKQLFEGDGSFLLDVYIDGYQFSDLCCSSCQGFLSLPPTLMDRYGNNICGRCANGVDKSSFMLNILYETLAYHFKFPCKFKKTGCVIKMAFGEMEAHEATCPYEIIKCLIKNCLWHGTRIELVIHYNIDHHELIIENDCLKSISEDVGHFLFATNEIFMLIEWTYCNYTFTLKIRRLDMCDSGDNILVEYTLSPLDPAKSNKIKYLQIDEHVAKSTCTLTEVPSFDSPIRFSINIQLPQHVINRKLEDKQKIKCPNCSTQMVPPILKCPSEHITCVDCTDSTYDYCKTCDDDELYFSRVPEIEYIALNSLYTCRWEGCNSNYSFREIQPHEQVCCKRIYMCLHCPQWHGLRNEIIPHDRVCQGKESECHMIVDTQTTFTGTAIKGAECALLAHDDLFWIIIEDRNGNTEVAVCNNGPTSLYGWYRYEVKLHHIENLNFPFNKTYNITNKSNNRYFVAIPPDDIDKFGGLKFFKLTIKVILLEGNDRHSNVSKYFQYFK